MKMNKSENYIVILNSLKRKIKQAQLKAIYTVNTELLNMYWEIGKTISDQEKKRGWGAKIVENLSRDLRNEFSDMKGLSVRNLRYMRDFAVAYPAKSILQAPLAKLKKNVRKIEPGNEILQASLAKLSWYHHITLLDKIKDRDIRFFYINKTIENGWSRNVMVHQIESGLHKSQGNLTTNFNETIPSETSDLVQQIFKDPYKFDFIALGDKAQERDLENALTAQMTDFLLALGQWFSFLGKQYRVTLGEKEYFYDLLFYHTRLKRYIVIELKIGDFKPEYLGKMEFYLTLADEQLKDSRDEKSIGLILCKTKDGLIAEYALRDSQKPIGIAEYKLNEGLPDNIKGDLPSIEEIEVHMVQELKNIKKPVDKHLQQLKHNLRR